MWAGTAPSQATEVSQEAEGSQAGKWSRAGVGGGPLHSPPHLRPSGPALGFLPQGRATAGAAGGCALDLAPCPLAPRPSPRASGNRGRPPGPCNPIPGGAGEGAGGGGGGAGPAGWVSERAAGKSVERADAAASHGPGAPAGRPPPRRQLPPPPTQRGRGEGEAASGSQAPSDFRDAALASPEGPAPAPLQASLRRPGTGWTFARTPGVPSPGRGSARGVFPAQTDRNLQPAARPPNGFLLPRSFWNGGDSWSYTEDHSFGQHPGGPIQVPGWPRCAVSLELQALSSRGGGGPINR